MLLQTVETIDFWQLGASKLLFGVDVIAAAQVAAGGGAETTVRDDRACGQLVELDGGGQEALLCASNDRVENWADKVMVSDNIGLLI